MFIINNKEERRPDFDSGRFYIPKSIKKLNGTTGKPLSFIIGKGKKAAGRKLWIC